VTAAPRPPGPVHARGRIEPVWTGNDHVFGLLREHAGERLLLLANFTPVPQSIHLGVAHERGLGIGPEAAVPDGRPLRDHGDFLGLEPYQFAWLQR